MEYIEQVRVTAEPSDCRIYCNDAYIGISPLDTQLRAVNWKAVQDCWYTTSVMFNDMNNEMPLTRTNSAVVCDGKLTAQCSEASYVFTAYKDGYEPTNKTVTITRADIQLAMSKLEPTPEGRLPYATGQRNVFLPLRRTATEPPARQQEQQQQQQQQQQTFVLPGQGEKPPEAIGLVIVSCNVEDAEVFADGVFVGNSPASLKLKDGIHIVEVKKTGYKPFRRELRVLSASEVSLRAMLEHE